ncbi:MAG: bifunctional phosphoglucose/phosphomannose isomerase, partial [Dehalococcoidia bacterium]|nr:bifunctional phosphoglucose/phosphomannose isomerase [Dehalococcoidia bacterium]
MNLDDPEAYAVADPEQMGRLISELPEHCATAWDAGLTALQLPSAYRQPTQVVALGMGGSAIGADLVRGLYPDELAAPMQVVRSYEIPAYVGPQTLVIACSHSGNTAESLAGFAEAERRGARLVAITTGGQLAVRAQQAGIPLVKYTCPSQPRAALGYSFASVLAIAYAVGLVDSAGADLPAAVDAVRAVGPEYAPARPEATNRAKQLARRLHQRVPTTY